MTQNNKPQHELKILMLDIEASNLAADFGFLLCIGYKWHGEKKTHVISIADAPTFKKDHTDDKWILQEFRKVVEQADMCVFHYGSRFDYPFLQARCLFHHLPPLPQIPAIDTWRIARYELRLSSNRLASLTNLLDIEEKTPLKGRVWVRAQAGHLKDIKYIVEHCVRDVEVLEKVYDRIAPLRRAGGGPVVSASGCPTCGSHHIQRRGLIRTIKTIKHRMVCMSCGHWFSRKEKK